jgi:hypothetical protein
MSPRSLYLPALHAGVGVAARAKGPSLEHASGAVEKVDSDRRGDVDHRRHALQLLPLEVNAFASSHAIALRRRSRHT